MVYTHTHVIGSMDTDKTEAALDDLSANGWELVTTFVLPDYDWGSYTGVAVVYVLRKPVEEVAD